MLTLSVTHSGAQTQHSGAAPAYSSADMQLIGWVVHAETGVCDNTRHIHSLPHADDTIIGQM